MFEPDIRGIRTSQCRGFAELRNMRTSTSNGAEGFRGPRAASGSPVGDRRPRLRWRVHAGTIDRHRLLAGMTQRQLAAAARVDPGTLSDLLRHRRRPTLGTIAALARALGLELVDVLEFED